VNTRVLNLFYHEPNPDRWLPFDRFPRAVVRRAFRGRPPIGGQKRVFINLCAGLDLLGRQYRVNDFRYARRNPHETVGIIGKPHVLDMTRWDNPIVFGPAVFSHPSDDPALLHRLDIRSVLVPGNWMRDMCQPFWGHRVTAWPVGIDTERWSLANADQKTTDVLIYDKILWSRENRVQEILQPIRAKLAQLGLTSTEIRYGSYKEGDYHSLLAQCRAMIFLCEHETQGIAYQQALSRGVPILAWDRGGPWQDPSYFPRINFGPVSSVPYWDDRCGVKFAAASDFDNTFQTFWELVRRRAFAPRDFILEHLTLERSAQHYVELIDAA
jgi:hypothetical protein